MPYGVLLVLLAAASSTALAAPFTGSPAPSDARYRDVAWDGKPGWLVLGAGLIVTVLDLGRARFGKQRKPSRAIPA